MQIGNSYLNSITSSLFSPLENRAVNQPPGTLTAAITAAEDDVAFPIFDLRQISPVQIDQLAKELRSRDLISDSDFLALRSRGAEFLSDIPGNQYTSEHLNQKQDLIGQLEAEVEAAKNNNDPVAAIEKYLDILRELNVRTQIPALGIFV